MKLVFIGQSHINCIKRASQQLGAAVPHDLCFVQLRAAQFAKDGHTVTSGFDDCNHDVARRAVHDATCTASLAILCPTGNEHFRASLIASRDLSQYQEKVKRLERLLRNYRRWLTALNHYTRSPVVVIPPPPPVESAEYILKYPGQFREKLGMHGVAPAHERLAMYRHQCQIIRSIASSCGLRLIDLPLRVFSEHGFLRAEFAGQELSHGNSAYGDAILRHVVAFAEANHGSVSGEEIKVSSADGSERSAGDETRSFTTQHPYAGLPDRAFWKQGVAQVPHSEFDPVGEVPFRISRSYNVATAGSCFAQHISKKLRSEGFRFLVTERVDEPVVDGRARGYYDFSARYGNIYTTRQLLQLFDRAYGYFSPIDNHWMLPDGRFCDPFRPRIEPGGYPSIAALVEDRQHHLAAVRAMFEQLDVFVFTLGLTECWMSRLDGAAYPIAPGVAGGEFDSSKYEFANFSVDEVVKDLKLFLHKLRLVNPQAKLLLTVSPVPLVATYEPNNVLVSTTYSKSVLRVAADVVSRTCEGVWYFPSFEIITGNYNRGRYFGPDLRSITEEGVDHVISVFMRHMTDRSESAGKLELRARTPASDDDDPELTALVEAICDEELLDRK